TSAFTNGTVTTSSSATVNGCSAPTGSTTAATRRWGPPGATSTSRRSAGRRRGRTRPRATRRPRPTSGGTGTTTTKPRPSRIRNGSRYPTPEKRRSESATQRARRDRGECAGLSADRAGAPLVEEGHRFRSVRVAGLEARDLETGALDEGAN